MTRVPASASRVAAASPATPPPITATSNRAEVTGSARPSADLRGPPYEGCCGPGLSDPADRASSGNQRSRPHGCRDEGALGAWHADQAAEDVVVGALDAREDTAVDRAHDARGDESSRVGARERGVGAGVVLAGAG